MKPVDFSKVLPIQNIEKGFLINGNGDITFGFSLMLPQVYSQNIDQYNEYMNDLTNLFCRLPAGTTIHKQDFYYQDIYKSEYKRDITYSRKHNLRFLDQKPVLRHYSNLYITISSNTYFNPTSGKNSFLSALDYVFKRPFADYTKQMATAEAVTTTVTNGLATIKELKIKRLNDKQLLGALVDYWNLSYDKPCLEPEGINLQPWEIENELKVGEQYVSILSLVNEGPFTETSKHAKTTGGEVYNNGNKYSNSVDLPTSMPFAIGLGFPVNHIINTCIEVFDTDWISTRLDIEKRKSNLLASMGHQLSVNKNKQIDLFVEELGTGKVTAARTTVNMIINHKEKKTLENYNSLAQSAFSNMNGSNVWIENFDTANLFIANTPGNAKTNYRGFISTVQHGLNYMPWETHYRSDASGLLLLDYFGNPTMVDTWSSPYLTGGRNMVIFGPTGTGKSVFINGLTDDMLDTGAHVITLDVGGSYKKLCALHDGLYIDSKERSKLTFNIFICNQDKDGKYLYNQDEDGEQSDHKINFVYSIISYIWKAKDPISQTEKSILRDCIKKFYEYINSTGIFPTLIEFNKYLETFSNDHLLGSDKQYFDVRSLTITLKEYVEGQYATLLNSTSNIQLKDYKYIVVDVKELQGNKDLLNIVSIVIIDLVLTKMASLDVAVRKLFLIDEALDFLMEGDMSDFIAGMYRKIRKAGGQIALATQDAGFLQDIPSLVQKSIVANADITVLLDHRSKKATYPILRNLLSFTDSDIQLLDSIENVFKSRGLFIKISTVSRLFRSCLSDEALASYTTDPKHLSIINKHYERLGNLGAAINQYVEDQRELQENN